MMNTCLCPYCEGIREEARSFLAGRSVTRRMMAEAHTRAAIDTGKALHLALGEEMRRSKRLEGFAEWIKYTKVPRATIVRVAKILTEGK